MSSLSNLSSAAAQSAPVSVPAPAVKQADLTSRVKDISDSTAEVAANLSEQKQHTSEAINQVRDKLDRAIEELQISLEPKNTNLSFTVDQVSDRVLVSVVDKNTGESVRQVPSEAILRVAHNLEALKGVLFDDRY